MLLQKWEERDAKVKSNVQVWIKHYIMVGAFLNWNIIKALYEEEKNHIFSG